MILSVKFFEEIFKNQFKLIMFKNKDTASSIPWNRGAKGQFPLKG